MKMAYRQTWPLVQPGRLAMVDARRAGFTLIELLVVIAIIGLIVAIAVPGIMGALQRGRSVKSAMNLRSWGQALYIGVLESGGRIPFEGSADNLTWALAAHPVNETAWFNSLPPLVGMAALRDLQTPEARALTTSETTIFRCPLVRFPERRNPPVNFSYMMNSQIYHPAGPAGTGNQPEPPVRLSHIVSPANTVMFADGQDPNRARGRGRHVDDRHRNEETHVVFMDGSLRRFSAEYLRIETMQANGITYTDNNKPDAIWNPWRGSHLTR